MKSIRIFVISVCLIQKLVAGNNGDEFDYELIGNPDETAQIERPCKVYDIHCIREYFYDHSHCKIANGPIPDPLIRSQESVYFSLGNATGTPTNVVITGLNNARIEEFYINRATNKLVIAIEFRNVSVVPRPVYFQFYRKGQEPVVSAGPTYLMYPSVVVTSVIPNIEDLQLDQAEIYSYSQDAFPPFAFSPPVFAPDPTVQSGLAGILADVPTAIREITFKETPFYAPTYIQYNICDFGIKVL